MSEHWAHNEELLADYVLGHVGAEQRLSLDSHLRECESCREVVASEMVLAAAAKRIGRSELKARLQKTALHQPEHGIPWPRILSAAALVVILIGVGVYNQWFITKSPTEPTIQEIPALAKKDEPPQPKQEAKQSTEIQAVAPKQKMAAPPSLKKESHTPEYAAAPAAGQDKDDSQEFAAKIADEKDAPKKMNAPQGNIQSEGFAGESAPNSVWINGTIIAGDDRKDQQQFEGMDSYRSYAYEERAANRAEGVRRNLLRSRSTQITQQPFASLSSQHQLQQSATTNSLPAQMQRIGGILQIILYPEHPFSDEALNQAKVTYIERDSIILSVDSLQAGYRIPKALLEPPIQQRSK